MCVEYKNRAMRYEVGDLFRRAGLGLDWADATPNRKPGKPYRPTNRATFIRPVDPANPSAGMTGEEMRWWLVPGWYRKPVSEWKSSCMNARIESLKEGKPAFREAYATSRGLVPVTSFIEYDEPPGWKRGQLKRRWEIDWLDGQPRFFAGLWARSRPADVPEGLLSFAFVTGDPGGDVAHVHDRQPFVLTLDEGLRWLDLAGPGIEMLHHPPVGSYRVTERPRAQDPDMMDDEPEAPPAGSLI